MRQPHSEVPAQLGWMSGALPNWLTRFDIHQAPVATALEGAETQGVLWQAAPGRFLLEAPGVARYLIENGRRITIDPTSQEGGFPPAESELARFLNLAPLAALLFQRGWLAFHAAAALSPASSAASGAVLLAGDSGTGKSTLLAGLQQRGWTPLADDLAAVSLEDENIAYIYPTLRTIRLWPEALEKLGIRTDTAVRGAATNSAQELIPAGKLPEPSPFPLRAIFWLRLHNRAEIHLERLRGAERFQTLGRLLYNTHIADALLERAAYFRQATAILAATPMLQVFRPRGRWSLAELVDHISAAI